MGKGEILSALLYIIAFSLPFSSLICGKDAELVEENNIKGFLEYLEKNRTKIHNSVVGDSYLTDKLNSVLMNALDKIIGQC